MCAQLDLETPCGPYELKLGANGRRPTAARCSFVRSTCSPKNEKKREAVRLLAFLQFQPGNYFPAFRSFQFKIELNPRMNVPCVCHRQNGRIANITRCPSPICS